MLPSKNKKNHIFLDHIINQSFTRWNGTNFTSNSSAWVCLSIWSRMDPTLSFSKTERSEFLPEPQVGLTDIEGKKLPNGEHPAIHWNRHNKTSRIQFSLFDFHSISHFPQVSEAVGDGVEWLRRSDLRFVRLPLGRPGVPATSSARWKVNWGAKKLVSPAPFRKMPKLCAFEILKLLLTTTAAFRYPTLISESHGDRLGEKELHLYWRDFHMGLGAGQSIFRS